MPTPNSSSSRSVRLLAGLALAGCALVSAAPADDEPLAAVDPSASSPVASAPSDDDPAAPAADTARDVFASDIQPFLATYCYECHGLTRQKSGIRFDTIDPDMVAGPDAQTWRDALDMLEIEDMPPYKARQPSAAERDAIVSWLSTSLQEAARVLEDEPVAVMRRLNKAWYTRSLQDLLGLSVDFGRTLPDDGKSAMGFTNNGEVLLASPLHLESYQAIARAALEQAIVVGPRPEPARYRVTLGAGVGVGEVGATTGGYQSVPLSPDDFTVDVLDARGRPRVGAGDDEQAALDAVKRKITVGFRGSSQDRFHVVEQGVVLNSALPHKEVAPGAWQGPSPNMKLELQRVFPQQGDFVLRVTASRGLLVRDLGELLVSLDEPAPRAGLVMRDDDRDGGRGEATVGDEDGAGAAMRSTVFGPWFQAGPVLESSADTARATTYVDHDRPLDLDGTLLDGVTPWVEVGDTDGVIQRYEGDIASVLLARVIDAPSARSVDVSLGSDDALWVWLNGEQVLARDVARGIAPDQDALTLDLRAGRNELLLQVVNFGGGFGSYHRVVHDGTSAGLAPYDVVAEGGARVLMADRSDQRENLRFEQGGLVAEDFPQPARARLFTSVEAGYYQFDLVHRALPPAAMGSIRFAVGESRLDLRPVASEADLARGHAVTPIGAGWLDAGQHELVLGGPFFVGFSHLVMTPLADDHPLVARLEAQQTITEFDGTPALRAFIGTRTDDGMDYMTFDAPVEVDAPLGAPRVFEFHGRLENLPIPEPDTGDDEILSGILVVGVWNDHLSKAREQPGAPVLVEALEFEAPYHPVWPPASHTRILFDSPLAADRPAYTEAVLSRFLERAFRRPVPDDELQRYVDYWRAVEGEFATYEEGLREVLVAALCSPSFLFLAEPEDARDADGRIAETALASRLSYFLWNAPPDGELRRLARAGQLRERLAEQVTRLLDDPRSQRFVRAFTREWLRLDRLEGMTINPNAFPAFTRFVKRDMAEETWRFVDHVLREDLSLFALVDSDFAMLNQNLAEFYGVEGVRGVDFRPVPLPREAGRGGLISQGAFLAGHSDGAEPHPIKRAVWVKGKLLGQPPPLPPPNVPDLDPTTPGFEQLTLKEKLERHRDSPSCRDCHAGFDAYGIALESYDAVGLLHTERKGRPVDASTVLPDGTPVDGPAGLKAYILERKADVFAESVVEHLFAYALGRDVGVTDSAELRGILDAVRGHGLRAVVQAIVASPSFSER